MGLSQYPFLHMWVVGEGGCLSWPYFFLYPISLSTLISNRYSVICNTNLGTWILGGRTPPVPSLASRGQGYDIVSEFWIAEKDAWLAVPMGAFVQKLKKHLILFSISSTAAAEGIENSLGEAQKPIVILDQCGLHHSGYACQQVHQPSSWSPPDRAGDGRSELLYPEVQACRARTKSKWFGDFVLVPEPLAVFWWADKHLVLSFSLCPPHALLPHSFSSFLHSTTSFRTSTSPAPLSSPSSWLPYLGSSTFW